MGGLMVSNEATVLILLNAIFSRWGMKANYFLPEAYRECYKYRRGTTSCVMFDVIDMYRAFLADHASFS